MCTDQCVLFFSLISAKYRLSEVFLCFLPCCLSFLKTSLSPRLLLTTLIGPILNSHLHVKTQLSLNSMQIVMPFNSNTTQLRINEDLISIYLYSSKLSCFEYFKYFGQLSILMATLVVRYIGYDGIGTNFRLAK